MTIPQNLTSVIANIIKIEGGDKFTDDPMDRGGATKFGITQAVWRANGWTGLIQNAPRELAETIYFNRYIGNPGFDRVFSASKIIGFEIIDTGVNMGPGVAGTFLQRWLNAFNYQNQYGGDLFPDGKIGDVSYGMLKLFLADRGKEGEQTLLRALNGIQAARYLDIAERDISQRKFIYGQINARVAP